MTMYFTKEHEWIRSRATRRRSASPISRRSQLGDIVFVELPEAGRQVSKGQEAAVVESVKAASDVYAPVSGEVTEGNQALADDPSLVNSDPRRRGLVLQAEALRHGELDGLMDEAAYREWVRRFEQ
jgi:glycine cleavage system H protein